MVLLRFFIQQNLWLSRSLTSYVYMYARRLTTTYHFTTIVITCQVSFAIVASSAVATSISWDDYIKYVPKPISYVKKSKYEIPEVQYHMYTVAIKMHLNHTVKSNGILFTISMYIFIYFCSSSFEIHMFLCHTRSFVDDGTILLIYEWMNEWMKM